MPLDKMKESWFLQISDLPSDITLGEKRKLVYMYNNKVRLIE